MKKLIPFLMLVGVTSGFSQGQVNFNNLPANFTDGATVDRFVYLNTVGGTKLSGTNFLAQLYYVAGNGLADPTLLGSLAPLTAAPGKFFASTTTSRLGVWQGGTRTFSNLGEGVQGTLMVRVWDGGDGTIDYAHASIKGESNPFLFTPPMSPPAPDQLLTYGLRAFAVTPEPSAIALGVLGIAGLLLIRRRK